MELKEKADPLSELAYEVSKKLIETHSPHDQREFLNKVRALIDEDYQMMLNESEGALNKLKEAYDVFLDRMDKQMQ
ncbi:MAG: hypothetical protein GY928_12800 [Colwellia sp.]|nr:hypothetical protein [Colwellia sp.]